MFLHQRLHEKFERTAHHDIELVDGEVDTVIGDAPLGLVVGANFFGAITGANEALAMFGLLGLLFRLCVIEKLCV